MARSSIQTDLSLDTTKFQRGLARSQKGVTNFANNAVKRFAALAGAAGMGALANSSVGIAKEIDNLSKLTGESVEDFQRSAHAAQMQGVSMEKFADIMKDVQDKVGDFLQTGAGPMADFFEQIAPKVGVTAEQFKNLSGKDALQLYVNSLEKANLSQSETTFFMEAIASDATLLLPLLKNNGKAFDTLGDNLKAFLTAKEIEQLKHYKNLFEALSAQLTIFAGKVITKTVPPFVILKEGLGGVGDIVGSLIGKFSSLLGFMGRSVKVTIDPVVKQFQSLAMGIKGVTLSLTNPIQAAKAFADSLALQKESVQSLLDVPSKLATEYARANEEMQIDSAHLEQSMIERSENITKAWNDMWSDNVESAKNSNAAILANQANTIDSNANKKEEADDDVDVAGAINSELYESAVDLRALGFSDGEIKKRLAAQFATRSEEERRANLSDKERAEEDRESRKFGRGQDYYRQNIMETAERKAANVLRDLDQPTATTTPKSLPSVSDRLQQTTSPMAGPTDRHSNLDGNVQRAADSLDAIKNELTRSA